MQDRVRFARSRRRTALAVAALFFAGASWVVGSAVAQVTAPTLDPAELFGGTPDNGDDAPPPPVHDPANPDHAKLQQPQEAFSALPADARGKPDWVRSLREGLIQPRSSVRGGQEMQVLELDVLMKNTAQMPYVKFPHGAHTQWLACANCHDALFQPKAGANPTTMPKILAGESCGVCHTKVAFTAMFTCERCHSVPQPGQQRYW
jgi:c(7)-type cytochrome triheme protein